MNWPAMRVWLARAVCGLGCIAWASWLMGVGLHDRWGWSQWLSWMPAIAVGVALLCGAIVVLLLLGASGRRAACVLALGAVTAFGWAVHGCVGLASPPAGLDRAVRILQWNTDWPSGDDPRSAANLAEHPVDIVLNSNHGLIMRRDAVAAWAPEGARAHFAGPFALVTRWPVVEARMVAAGGRFHEEWFVARFTVVPPGWDGHPLRIAMVDLPSRPTLPKREVAAALLQGLHKGSLGEVDLVVGDFNAIDGSVILDGCFAGFRDALAESGRGWLCTWPRRFPLWKIDHVLLGDTLRAVDAVVLDPGTSHHRMTQVDIEPR